MKPAIDSSALASLLASAEAHKGAPDAVVRLLLAALRKHLGMDVAFVAEFEEGQRVFRYVDAAVEGAPRPGERDRPEGALVMGRPVGSQLCVPMVDGHGRTYGTLTCFNRDADPTLSERDLALTRVFAGLALQAIERGRAADYAQAEIRKRISHVLQLEKVYAVYQPMVSLNDMGVIGFECLSRFDAEPRQGPDFWFAEAASVGLGSELELGVIRRALRALEQLPKPIFVSCNVSPQLLLEGRLQHELDARAAQRLVLEITEHETVKEYERLVSVLEPLRRSGVRVAIDDAGAGYSTFRHIVRLNPDVIKLDLRLTRDIDQDPARRALAAALIRYAREARAEIIAEGVETQSELDTLLALGITTAQGFYFGKPMPLDAAVELAAASLASQ